MTKSFAQNQGKKHAQRVRVFLQAKRAEKTKKEDAAAQVNVQVDALICPLDKFLLVIIYSNGGTSRL